MDVWRITVAVLRRWYVFLPLLALTGYAAMTLGNGVKPQYEATATVVLVPGQAPSEVENPYGGLSDTAEVLAIVLDDAAVRDRIKAQGLNPEYEFSARSRSSIMNFTTLSDSPEVSLKTGQTVLDLAREELAERQGSVGIPEGAQVDIQVLQAPAVSDVVATGKLRIMAVVGILGAALALLAAVLFDDLVGLLKRWIRRWQDRRRARRQEGRAAQAPESTSEISEVSAERAGADRYDRDVASTLNGRERDESWELQPTGRQR